LSEERHLLFWRTIVQQAMHTPTERRLMVCREYAQFETSDASAASLSQGDRKERLYDRRL